MLKSSFPPHRRFTLQVTHRSRSGKLQVVADATGLVSRSGSALLVELADAVGLTEALGEVMADTRQRRSAHDPGVVLRDLAVMLADGGDALSDLGALRDQVALFGPVASERTAWRTIGAVDDAHLRAIRAARARARARAWAVGARPDRLVLDIDATLVTAHSDKEGAAPTYKRGFGFHPILCYRDGSDEALSGRLRPGNAGSNTAADHIDVLIDGLAQLPGVSGDPAGCDILVRTDSGGATHAFLDVVADRGMDFSVGFDLTEPVRRAVPALPAGAWSAALTQSGELRDGAWVAEIFPDLRGWPAGTRAICRKERPHPGAQLTFTDADGHRFQVFITNQEGEDIACLEARHRAHARVEDRIRTAKDTGLSNLPFRAFAHNALWLELVLMAQDLTGWAQTLTLTGDLASAEPKRLRYRLLHVAGRITRSGRQTRLHLPASWPWAQELVAAFARLRALPAPVT